jgi:putative membrane protein
MIRIILYLFINVLCILALDKIVPGIKVSSWESVVVFLGVLSLINYLIVPVVKLFTFPINLISFGLFGMVINFFALVSAIQLSKGITIVETNNLKYILLVALISVTLSVANSIVNTIIDKE